MSLIDYSSLIAVALSAMLAFSTMLLAVQRRSRDRRERLYLEEIRLRETELKYSSVMSSQARQTAVELVQESLRTLDRIDAQFADSMADDLRPHFRELRKLEYAQLESLLVSFNEDRGEAGLERLQDLLKLRRTGLDSLSGSEGPVSADG